MTYDSNNIFARILRKDIPCKKVLEDDFGLAFHDAYPQAPLHVLAIPKGPFRHALDFYTLASSDMLQGFNQFLGRVIDHLDIAPQGYRLITNHGKNGGQEVPHFHIHILAGKVLGPMIAKETS